MFTDCAIDSVGRQHREARTHWQPRRADPGRATIRARQFNQSRGQPGQSRTVVPPGQFGFNKAFSCEPLARQIAAPSCRIGHHIAGDVG